MGRLCYGVQAEKASVETFEERDGGGGASTADIRGQKVSHRLGQKSCLSIKDKLE